MPPRLGPATTGAKATVDKAKQAREERRLEKERKAKESTDGAAMKIVDRLLRRKLSHFSTAARLRREFDASVATSASPSNAGNAVSTAGKDDAAPGVSLDGGGELAATSSTDAAGPTARPLSASLSAGGLFDAVAKLQLAIRLDGEAEKGDRARMVLLSKHILASMATPGASYAALCLKKGVAWMMQVKALVPSLLDHAVDEAAAQIPSIQNIATFLTVMIRLLDTKTWGSWGTAAEIAARKKPLAALCGLVQAHVRGQGLLGSLSELLLCLFARKPSKATPAVLQATLTLGLVPTLTGAAGAPSWVEVVRSFLTVPGLVAEIFDKIPTVGKMLVTTRAGWKCTAAMGTSDKTVKMIFDGLPARMRVFFRNDASLKNPKPLHASSALFLIGNLAHLATVSLESATADDLKLHIMVITQLLELAKSFIVTKKSSIRHDHPILGWVSEPVPTPMLDVLPAVSRQLRMLWCPLHIAKAFQPCLAVVTANATKEAAAAAKNPKKAAAAKARGGKRSWLAGSIFARSRGGTGSSGALRGGSAANAAEFRHMAAVCKLYTSCSFTLAKHQDEIMSSIAFSPGVVAALWNYLPALGQRPAMSVFLKDTSDVESATQLLELLQFACQLASLLITVLNDDEIYEKGDPVSVTMLVEISDFLNRYVFKALWHLAEPAKRPLVVVDGAGSAKVGLNDSLAVRYATRLLSVIYDCDCRRVFSEEGHWLTTEITTKTFEAELDREREARLKESASPTAHERARQVLMKIPHVLPHLFRMRLFRDEIHREKSAIAAGRDRYADTPHITIRRAYLLTDGVREVPRLPVDSLKDTFRIKFINRQGLDEAGIDENGVFKEYLEESVKQAFDPDFGLFTITPTNQIYPNPIAAQVHHDDHLLLFEFVGILLGKAMYEGHLIELPFCQFFVNTIVGRHNTLDELPSLDPELSKNLAFVKTYEGDVADLDLCFAVDEDVLGKMVTHDLRPGGATIEVNNENRILYCHLMADYRLNKQLKKYCDAFLAGFRKVITTKWLRSFSAPEIQRLISGDNVRLDVDDLKRYTSYVGGYSSGHKGIRWLWQIVAEFEAEDQGAFLKFVTSCSKPPVLGFKTLQPPFMIRMVTDASQEDRYTLGSSVVNFFRPGTNTDRLPTSSTCFNLLKLPMYKSKRVLREKLKYSINSGAGFELS